MAFAASYALNAVPEIAAQRGGEIGISIGLKIGQSVLQVFPRLPDIVAQDAAAIIFAAAFARVFKIPVMAEFDEARLEPIVIAFCDRFDTTDLVRELPRRPTICVKRVTSIAGRFQQIGEPIQELDQLVDPR